MTDSMRLKLHRVMGKGAFADVWQASDTTTGKHVACKLFKKDYSKTAVRYEYCMGKTLDHPNIVRTKACMATKSKLMIVQEFVSGGELFDRIENDYGMEEFEARAFMRDVVSALEYMHEMGVVHRDIKPENILVTEEGIGKLCDLGMAEYAGEVARRGSGTVPYMPPEVLKSLSSYTVAKSYDVWSTGVLLYILLVGDFPWLKATDDDEEFAAFMKGNRTEYPWNSFSPELTELFEKMLHSDPAKRCSISEVKSYLDKPWFLSESTSKLSGSQSSAVMADGKTSLPKWLSPLPSDSASSRSDSFDRLSLGSDSSHMSARSRELLL